MPLKNLVRKLFIRQIALPTDHGSWVFLLSPLLIGLFGGGPWSGATLIIILACLAAFLLRQPVTNLVKIYSGRRNRRDLAAAWFWTLVYSTISAICLIILILQNFNYLLLLALPGIPVFTWHLYLVSRRAERRQAGVEIIGSGVLALSAPAIYWVSIGNPEPIGWWLFVLTWLQSAASIVYAYLRLAQRELKALPELSSRIHIGKRALLYTSFNFFAVATLSILGKLPTFLPIPYFVQFGETIWGTLSPAIGYRPTAIGVRQLIISSTFTVLFILTWS